MGGLVVTESVLFHKVRVHPVFIVCVLIADAGASIPFSFRHGPGSSQIPALEWVLDGLFWAASLALIARLSGFLKPHRDAWPLAVSAGVWAAYACYAGFFLIAAQWEYRLGFGLIFIAWSFLCAFVYVREVYG
jgi:hypothetical protein